MVRSDNTRGNPNTPVLCEFHFNTLVPEQKGRHFIGIYECIYFCHLSYFASNFALVCSLKSSRQLTSTESVEGLAPTIRQAIT